MIDILRSIFKPCPKPGEIFIFDESWRGNDPFSKERVPFKVEVLEVKEGFVKYRWLSSARTDSAKRSHFHFCYKKYEEDSA